MNYSVFYICVSGFTQTRGTFNGILKIREKLISEGFSNGIHQRVWYLPWTSKWMQIAADLSTVCSFHGVKPIVLISGYSYGGWGAIQLAGALDSKGINVHTMILSDPVARPNWLPRYIPAASSLLGRKYSRKLHIPPNVERLYSFFQVKNRPQGHQLVISNGTDVNTPIELSNKTHDRMDDAVEFHGRVVHSARSIREEFIKE